MNYKFIVLIFIILLQSTVSGNEEFNKRVHVYDKLFNEISQKRSGASDVEISNVKNPFVMETKKIVSIIDTNNTIRNTEQRYILSAIVINKAKINGKWYKKNNEIGDFKLLKIKNKSVVLSNEHKTKELFIRKHNVGKIKFSSK